MNKSDLNLKHRVNRQVQQSGKSIQKLAREMDMSYSGVWQMLGREQLTLERLAQLSRVLQYNFFRELAQDFEYPNPDYSNTAERNENAVLQKRVQELELEVRVLKEAIGLMK